MVTSKSQGLAALLLSYDSQGYITTTRPSLKNFHIYESPKE